MGDRTYISFYLSGHIATVKALHELCEAIAAQGLGSDDFGSSMLWADDIKCYLAELLSAGDIPTSIRFHDDEHNYADVSDLESVCQKHGIAYSLSHDSGSEFSAAVAAYLPDGPGPRAGERFWARADDEPLLPLSSLTKLLDKPDALELIRAEVTKARKANGFGQPGLSFGDEVRDYLETLRAAALLDALPSPIPMPEKA